MCQATHIYFQTRICASFATTHCKTGGVTAFIDSVLTNMARGNESKLKTLFFEPCQRTRITRYSRYPGGEEHVPHGCLAQNKKKSMKSGLSDEGETIQFLKKIQSTQVYPFHNVALQSLVIPRTRTAMKQGHDVCIIPRPSLRSLPTPTG